MIDEVLIVKFIAGETNDIEKRDVEQWIAASAVNAQKVAHLTRIWNSSASMADSSIINMEHEWEVLQNTIQSFEQHKRVPVSLSKRTGNRFGAYGLQIAASLLILIGISFAIIFHFQTKPRAVVYHKITVPLGSKALIQLPDKSQVWLNSGSELTYPAEYGETAREVSLIGEAFFDVAKNPAIPFIVKASGLYVKALGTSFNIKCYPEEGTIETTLVEGKVSITSGKNKQKKELVQLSPNQRATYTKDKENITVNNTDSVAVNSNQNNLAKPSNNNSDNENSKLLISKKIDTKVYTAWRENKLVFDNESFESIAIKFERWYNIEIIFQDESIKRYRYTGVVQNETIEQALEALQIASPFYFTVNQNKFVLTTKKNSDNPTKNKKRNKNFLIISDFVEY